MKCDEKREICGPCERSGRECVYKDGFEPLTHNEVRESLFRWQNLRPHYDFEKVKVVRSLRILFVSCLWYGV